MALVIIHVFSIGIRVKCHKNDNFLEPSVHTKPRLNVCIMWHQCPVMTSMWLSTVSLVAGSNCMRTNALDFFIDFLFRISSFDWHANSSMIPAYHNCTIQLTMMWHIPLRSATLQFENHDPFKCGDIIPIAAMILKQNPSNDVSIRQTNVELNSEPIEDRLVHCLRLHWISFCVCDLIPKHNNSTNCDLCKS